MVTVKELRNKGKELKPVVNIGKLGMTVEVIAQVKIILQKKKLIKVKFLRSFLDAQKSKSTKEIAKELTIAVNANLIEVVGMVVVLSRK